MNTNSRAARRAAVVAAVTCGGAFVAVLAAACGSQAAAPPAATPTATGSASPSATSSSAAAVGVPRMPASQCPTSALHVTVDVAKGSAAAGTSYVPIDFTNVSDQSCAMYGFPGVSFVTGHPGSQIGDAASRETTFGSETVTLAANGGTAHAWLGVADAGNFPASACHQVTAHVLRIYPPDQYASLYTSFTSPVCSAKITGGSTPLTILPIRPGLGNPGTVP